MVVNCELTKFSQGKDDNFGKNPDCTSRFSAGLYAGAKDLLPCILLKVVQAWKLDFIEAFFHDSHFWLGELV